MSDNHITFLLEEPEPDPDQEKEQELLNLQQLNQLLEKYDHNQDDFTAPSHGQLTLSLLSPKPLP